MGRLALEAERQTPRHSWPAFPTCRRRTPHPRHLAARSPEPLWPPRHHRWHHHHRCTPLRHRPRATAAAPRTRHGGHGARHARSVLDPWDGSRVREPKAEADTEAFQRSEGEGRLLPWTDIEGRSCYLVSDVSGRTDL